MNEMINHPRYDLTGKAAIITGGGGLLGCERVDAEIQLDERRRGERLGETRQRGGADVVVAHDQCGERFVLEQATTLRLGGLGRRRFVGG